MLAGEYPNSETRPPTTRAEKRPPRVSAHSMQSPTGCPALPTGTVDPHWPVMPTPSSCAASTALEASVARTPSWIRSHHSLGSCTAPPPGMYRVRTEDMACARRTPSEDTAPTFGPPVPRSMARYQGSATTVRGRDLVHGVERGGEQHVQHLIAGGTAAEPVQRAALRLVTGRMLRVLHGLVQVGDERLGHPRRRVGPRDAKVQRRRQLQRIEPPPFLDEAVVDVIDVQLGRAKGHQEGRVADDLELRHRRHPVANGGRGPEDF